MSENSFELRFGKLLGIYLGKERRSQSWLAERLGVVRNTVHRWMKDPIRPGEPERILMIAVLLKLKDSEYKKLLKATRYELSISDEHYYEIQDELYEEFTQGAVSKGRGKANYARLKAAILEKQQQQPELLEEDTGATDPVDTPPMHLPTAEAIQPPQSVASIAAESQRSEADVSALFSPRRSTIPMDRPPQVPHFTGRTTEIEWVLQHLHPGAVVTVCGAGGMGKTALAVEVAWRLAPDMEPPERFPDGILFHSFHSAPQAEHVFGEIVRWFGEERVEWEVEKPKLKTVARRALSGRRALLILDGAENASDLPAILEICNQCGVLVTTRRRSDAVPPRLELTPLPNEDAVTLLQALGGVRARNMQVAQEICELVGGLPLAVRLAGSHLWQYEREAIEYVEWLAKEPLATLDRGGHEHDGISVLFAQNLTQVSEMAQSVLGVAGLLALAPLTAECIAYALELPADVIHPAFDELVNYGLLVRPTLMYEISHPLIHTYARQRVASSDQTASRLATYYTMVVAKDQDTFTYLDEAHSHVMALLDFCRRQQRWPEVQHLAQVIAPYLDLRGYVSESIEVLKASITAAQALQDAWSEGNARYALGKAYYFLGQYEQTIHHHEQALEKARENGNRQGESKALAHLGAVHNARGEYERSIADYYEPALQIAEAINSPEDKGNAHGGLGNTYRNLGRLEQAITHYEFALTYAEKTGDRRMEGAWLGNIGETYRWLGDAQKAIDYNKRGLHIAREIKAALSEAFRLRMLGSAYRDLGDHETARLYFEEALPILIRFESPEVAKVRADLDGLK